MPKYVKTTWYGTFLYNDEGVIDATLFPQDVEAIADRLHRIQNGEILDEERALQQHDAIAGEHRLASLFSIDEHIPDVEVTPEDYGFTPDLLHRASIMLTEQQMQQERGQRSTRIAAAVHALDDLLKTRNILMEHLEEWASYFVDVPDSDDLPRHIIEDWHIPGSDPLDQHEEASLIQLARVAADMHQTRETLEAYVSQAMQQMAPNVSALVGEPIAARLIAAAGGLRRLAEMPAGTIQVLGAEKALFQHLRKGTPPPKHGIIFQHEWINTAPKKKRGKIARSLAGKIAIAARADAFTGRDIAGQLREEITQRMAEIRKG
ncbi:MAG: NOP5/NOP56 family protein [Thermoplasmatota archaeon]